MIPQNLCDIINKMRNIFSKIISSLIIAYILFDKVSYLSTIVRLSIDSGNGLNINQDLILYILLISLHLIVLLLITHKLYFKVILPYSFINILYLSQPLLKFFSDTPSEIYINSIVPSVIKSMVPFLILAVIGFSNFKEKNLSPIKQANKK